MKRKLSVLASIVSISIAMNSAELLADTRRGLVTSGSCPLTCKDLRVPEADCEERRLGSECQVEDFRQPAGFQTVVQVKNNSKKTSASLPGAISGAQTSSAELETTAAAREPGRRGLVTTSSCPLSCRELAIPTHFCEERSLGSTCEVEDFRYGPGHQSLVRVPR